jgi:hypothetical protein
VSLNCQRICVTTEKQFSKMESFFSHVLRFHF